MSMQFSVYVGAYLLVPTGLVRKSIERQSCTARCGEPLGLTNGRFCFGCGAELQTVSHEDVRVKHWHCSELGQDFEDMFYTPESARSDKRDLWLPNQHGSGTIYDTDNTNIDALVAMDEHFVQQKKSAFMEKYGAVPGAIEAQFKVKPVLQVGVVPFCA